MRTLLHHIPAPELELIDADGRVYPLAFPERHVQQVSGLGMPPIQHWTTRSPYQHGRTHWGYSFGPRVINLVLLSEGRRRREMWDLRRSNVAMLSPQRGAMRLRLVLPNGHRYELRDVWYNAGYELDSADQPDPRHQIGGVQLIAYDPFWKWITSPLPAGHLRDDEGRTCISVNEWTGLAENLVLPFTGPYLLGRMEAAEMIAVNVGDQPMRPRMVIRGPISAFVLANATSGHQIRWDGYEIAAGETVTLDIGEKSCVSDRGGGSLFPFAQGDTGTFSIFPGENELRITAYETSDGVTEFSVCWYVEASGL